jgi:hypothetical protein
MSHIHIVHLTEHPTAAGLYGRRHACFDDLVAIVRDTCAAQLDTIELLSSVD